MIAAVLIFLERKSLRQKENAILMNKKLVMLLYAVCMILLVAIVIIMAFILF